MPCCTFSYPLVRSVGPPAGLRVVVPERCKDDPSWAFFVPERCNDGPAGAFRVSERCKADMAAVVDSPGLILFDADYYPRVTGYISDARRQSSPRTFLATKQRCIDRKTYKLNILIFISIMTKAEASLGIDME
jgi:hypothetical protein